MVRLPFRNIADKVLRQNFEFLASVVPYMTFGLDNLTWSGSSRLTNTKDISHGLGRTPAAVFFTSRTTNMTVAANSTLDDTVVGVTGNTVDGSTPAAGTTRDFFWLAVG